MEVPVPGEYRQGKQQGSRPVDYVDSSTVPVSHPASAVRRWQLDCGDTESHFLGQETTPRARKGPIIDGSRRKPRADCWEWGVGISEVPQVSQDSLPRHALIALSRRRKAAQGRERYRYVRC